MTTLLRLGKTLSIVPVVYDTVSQAGGGVIWGSITTVRAVRVSQSGGEGVGGGDMGVR